ncbi:MAG: acylneuraminate cytidylyltransferase [bacterium]|nr:acylneuraminate cytidylyltransferase [bacterium]
MKNLGNIVIHIPAREGSKRVRTKNLRYIAGAPLLSYAVKAALGTSFKDNVYVNTESETIGALAESLGAKVYLRPPEFAGDDATSDQYNMNIIDTLKPDTLIQINPVCPLLLPADIESIINAYKNEPENTDTLITSTTTQMQCFCEDKPVNIDLGSQLAPSQLNPHVHVCNWAVTVWDANKFRERFKKQGFAVFGSKLKLLPIHPLKAIKISVEEDFEMAEFLLNKQNQTKQIEKAIPTYWQQPGL